MHLIELLASNPFSFMLTFGGLIFAIGLHEAAHCYMADYLGDPTPRSMGRLTLNPLVHLDLLGTLAILFAGFGWGKPAPFDPYNLKNPKKDTTLIALAGPVTNIVIAIALGLSLRFVSMPTPVYQSLLSILFINLNLAFFNLIPVPPLDGSKIIGALMSHESATKYQRINNPLLLLALIFPIFRGASLASIIISPAINAVLRLLV
jgi:Zn-dependent protease